MADVPIGDVLKDDQLAAFCKALPKAELHQHMSGSFRRVSLLSASYVQYLLHFFFFLFFPLTFLFLFKLAGVY